MTAKCQRCDDLARELGDAKELLEIIAAHAASTAHQAAREMDAGDVPQGRYAYLKGQHRIASAVLELMNRQAAKEKSHRPSGLFSGFLGG